MEQENKTTKKHVGFELYWSCPLAGPHAFFKKAADLGTSQPPTVTPLCWKRSDMVQGWAAEVNTQEEELKERYF